MLSFSQPLPGYSKYVMVKHAASQVRCDFQDRDCLLFLYLQRAQQCRTLSLAGGGLGFLISITNNGNFS